MTFLLLTLFLAPQDARELIEKLRSESVVDRQDAARKLKALGEAARPVLEQAANDSDGEVATRARHLLRLLEVRKLLTPAFRKTFPEAEEELSVDRDAASLKYVLLASELTPQGPLSRSDLDPLGAGALRGARSPEEKKQALRIVSGWRLRTAGPALPPFLSDPDEGVRAAALYAALSIAWPLTASQLDPFWNASHPDETRRTAAEALLRLGTVDSIPRFTRLLEDRSAAVRQTALAGLADLGSRDSIPAVLKCLKDPIRDVRYAALRCLHALDARETLPAILARASEPRLEPFLQSILRDWRPKETTAALLPALKSADPDLQGVAAELLGAAGSREAIPALVPLLASGEGVVALSAVNALVLLDAREAVPAAVRLLDSPAGGQRFVGLILLQRLGVKEAVGDLCKRLESDDPELRTLVSTLLAQWKATEAVPTLLSLLEDRREPTVRSALQLLGELNARHAVPSVRKLVDHPDFGSAAVEVLARLGDPDARSLLVPRLGPGKDPLLRLRAIRGLVQLGSSESAADIDGVLADRDPDLRIAALRALLVLERPLGQRRAIERLKDEDWRVREAALAGLIRHPVPTAGSAILPLMNDPEDRVRPPAIRAAGFMASAETVPALRKILSSSRHWEVVSAAIEACERLGARDAIPEIRAHFQGTSGEAWDHEGVRARAAWTLARLGDAGEATLLVRSVPRTQGRTQAAVVQALGFLARPESEPALLDEFLLLTPQPGEFHEGRALAALKSEGGAAALRAVEAGWEGSGRILGEFEPSGRVRKVKALLASPSAGARRESLAALAAWGARDVWREVAALLGDRHFGVRAAAAQALGRFGVAESIPELLQVGRASPVALALCRLGRREGAGSLLLEASFELNALRQPTAWDRLRSTPLPEDLTGTPAEILQKILGRAGLGVEVTNPVLLAKEDFSDTLHWVWRRNGRTSLLDALEEILPAYLAPDRPRLILERPRLILERDRLRVVFHDEAREFWKAWWAETPK